MKSELSSLLDDELEADRQQTVLSALRGDAELRATWDNYQLIGDGLRRSSHLQVNLTSRVMADLRREPTVLAPQARPVRDAALPRYAAALAASLAGVGVVGWMVLASPQQVVPQKSVVAIAAPARAFDPTNAANVANANRLQAYLVAHQAYSPSNRFDGGAGYVRAVAAVR